MRAGGTVHVHGSYILLMSALLPPPPSASKGFDVGSLLPCPPSQVWLFSLITLQSVPTGRRRGNLWRSAPVVHLNSPSHWILFALSLVALQEYFEGENFVVFALCILCIFVFSLSEPCPVKCLYSFTLCILFASVHKRPGVNTLQNFTCDAIYSSLTVHSVCVSVHFV